MREYHEPALLHSRFAGKGATTRLSSKRRRAGTSPGARPWQNVLSTRALFRDVVC
jgi:hypothetical protein